MALNGPGCSTCSNNLSLQEHTEGFRSAYTELQEKEPNSLSTSSLKAWIFKHVCTFSVWAILFTQIGHVPCMVLLFSPVEVLVLVILHCLLYFKALLTAVPKTHFADCVIHTMGEVLWRWTSKESLSILGYISHKRYYHCLQLEALS